MWQAGCESNTLPTDYESAALTNVSYRPTYYTLHYILSIHYLHGLSNQKVVEPSHLYHKIPQNCHRITHVLGQNHPELRDLWQIPGDFFRTVEGIVVRTLGRLSSNTLPQCSATMFTTSNLRLRRLQPSTPSPTCQRRLDLISRAVTHTHYVAAGYLCICVYVAAGYLCICVYVAAGYLGICVYVAAGFYVQYIQP